jgi:signal transduction histidine kinase
VHEVTSADTAHGEIVVAGERRTLTPAAEACLYRVAKESVSNVVKHAQASRFQVRIEYEPDGVRLEIVDDGVGFERSAKVPADREEGIGLKSIEERIRREGGELAVASEPGKGTKIAVRIPVNM